MTTISYRDESLQLEDGIKLISRIWHPKDGGPWPTLLMRQPYGREIASTITYPHPEWWANKGYLVIVQDIRGKGDSEGKFIGFNQEYSDTTLTHNWIRGLPESNGKLGTYGFSYQGLTQLLANNGTKAPDCIATAMTGLKECEHWSCEGGAYWWHIGLSWGLQLAAQKQLRENNYKNWDLIKRSLEDNSYLRDGPELLKKFDPNGMAITWLENSNKDFDNWRVHNVLDDWLKKPMLLIGGWWDPHLSGIIDLYQKSKKIGGKPELHIGPATHLNWWKGTEYLLLDFFNTNLKLNDHPIIDDNKITQVKLWNITENKWVEYKWLCEKRYWDLNDFMIKSEHDLNYNIEKTSYIENDFIIVHDPWRPVESLGGHLSPSPGLVDRLNVDKRNDVATLTSDPINQLIHIEGIPCLELYSHSDKKSFDLFVSISILDKDKKISQQISTGVLRIKGIQALKSIKRKITLQPLCMDIKKGESLRISISGSAWPAISINPGDPQKNYGAPSPESEVITIYFNLKDSTLKFLPLL